MLRCIMPKRGVECQIKYSQTHIHGTSTPTSFQSESFAKASAQVSPEPSSKAAFAVSSRTGRPCMHRVK